ncbi:MAG: SIMPL domain-containing protein [Myxococcota bacterium]
MQSAAFGTSRLAGFRREVCRSAVVGALEKAELYAETAGMALGDVIHIEDIDPGSIVVGGAVQLTCPLLPRA